MAIKLKTFPAITVTVAGQAVRASSTPYLVSAAVITSLSTNTGTQYVGDSTVTAANGTPFGPGEGAEIDGLPSPRGHEQFDLSEIYLNSSTANAAFRVVAWVREGR